MGAGNWSPNGGDHNGEFFYIGIPFFEDDSDYADRADFWNDDLIPAVRECLPKCYESSEGWVVPFNETHWGEDFFVAGESSWYFVGLKWWHGYVVCFVGLRDNPDYCTEESQKTNLGHHALGHSRQIYKKLHSMGYEIRFRTSAWTSALYEGEKS